MSAAAATALSPQMSREKAIEILNRMPYLVCTSNQKLLQSMVGSPRNRKRSAIYARQEVYLVEFQVSDGRRTYTFESQPFYILCQITKAEFKAAAPWAAVTARYFYRVSTD
jgi:hypothetical protein